MKYLVIAEKPSVARSISKVIGAYKHEDGYLEGGDCVVSWCLGHLAEYAAPEYYDERYKSWRFDDLPILPEEWKLLVSEDKKAHFNILRKLLRSKDFDYVVNACDAGREGEAIFRRVYGLAGSKLPVKRLWISSMEDSAIQQGFDSLKDGAEYDNLFIASECRTKADWLIGMNGTRAFTKKYGRRQTIGRVQTPTLAMLTERQNKIQNFVKEPYYKVEITGNGIVAESERMAQEQDADTMQAACVKKVFELALSGRNTTQIAYGMNELNLPTPGLYAKRKNLLMGSNPIIAPDSEMLWNAAIVWRILRRYEYTGALVMGRRKKIDVNTTSVRTLPEDKWIIAENAHAAIVTKDEYYQAQKAIRNVTPIQYKVGDDFALKGKICCGNCNRQLRHERQYGEMVFYCGYKRSAGKFSKCYGGYYREYSVNAKVARAIKTVFYALDVVNQGMQEKQSITVRCMDIEDLEKQAEAIRVEQIKLYESYADGVLLRDAYIEKKKALSEKLAALQDSIRTEKEEQECADELDEEIRALTKQASEKTYIGGLTKECVDAFVSMVYLYDDQTMKIEFNCEDVIRRALEKYGA